MKKFKVVYLPGPYSDSDNWVIADRIHEAKRISRMLWRDGYAVICPHGNTGFMGNSIPYDTYIAGDLEIISRCDTVFMLPKWEGSRGSIIERDFAIEKGIPIKYLECVGLDSYKLTSKSLNDVSIYAPQIQGIHISDKNLEVVLPGSTVSIVGLDYSLMFTDKYNTIECKVEYRGIKFNFTFIKALGDCIDKPPVVYSDKEIVSIMPYIDKALNRIYTSSQMLWKPSTTQKDLS